VSADEFERERDEAIELAHKAMTSSYIGSPPPGLRGDADRMVAALLKAGWTPPSDTIVEHATEFTGGRMLTRPNDPELEQVYPLAEWIKHQQNNGTPVYKRRVIVVEDWRKVPRER